MTRGQTKCLTVGLRVDSASEGSPSGTKLLSARAVGLMKQYARRPSLQASSAWRRETGVVNSHFFNTAAQPGARHAFLKLLLVVKSRFCCGNLLLKLFDKNGIMRLPSLLTRGLSRAAAAAASRPSAARPKRAAETQCASNDNNTDKQMSQKKCWSFVPVSGDIRLRLAEFAALIPDAYKVRLFSRHSQRPHSSVGRQSRRAFWPHPFELPLHIFVGLERSTRLARFRALLCHRAGADQAQDC